MSPSGAELLRQVKSKIAEVDPSEVKELIDEGVTIVDVRGTKSSPPATFLAPRAFRAVIWSRASRAPRRIAPPS